MAAEFLRRFVGKPFQPSERFEFYWMMAIRAILLDRAAQDGGTGPDQGRL
jgi:hypothetical protein